MKISETKMVGYESWEGGQWQCPKKECYGIFIEEEHRFCPGCGEKIEWDKPTKEFVEEWFGKRRSSNV